MSMLRNAVGIVLLVIGAVWVLQGANVLTGSAMSGRNQWLVVGLLMAVAGVALLWWNRRAGQRRMLADPTGHQARRR
jgi:protein-S-isoprenylcysteine O-methyltransferase Ste14